MSEFWLRAHTMLLGWLWHCGPDHSWSAAAIKLTPCYSNRYLVFYSPTPIKLHGQHKPLLIRYRLRWHLLSLLTKYNT